MAQKKYRQKPIEAWQLTLGDFAAIVVWCSPDSHDDNAHTLVIGNTSAGLGDYVIKDIFGAFSIIEADEFAIYYDGDSTFTEAITLENGETIDNATNGLVNVTGNIGVNGVKVVGDQVAAIGLDAKADAAKITDIIAALRAHGLLGPNA